MAATPLFAVPSLDNSYGAIFIGMVAAAGLWGIGTAQVYWYFTTYTKDKVALKLLVSALWCFDTVHQALISYLIYYYVITNYFNPLHLDFQIWVFSIQSLFELIPCFIVQSFFCIRIWKLSNGNWSLVILPALFVLSKFVVGIVWIGLCFRIPSILEAEAKFGHISEIINGLAVGGDILLAGTMVWLLHRARTGIRQSDNMVAKLMMYTINTGVITSVWSIITLITAVRFNRTYIYGAFYFCIGRLYVNTMLASLNARQGLKGHGNVVHVEMSGGDFSKPTHGSHSGGRTLATSGDGKHGTTTDTRSLEEFVAKPGNVEGSYVSATTTTMSAYNR